MVYLDHAATTPCAPRRGGARRRAARGRQRVVDPRRGPGRAKRLLEEARERLAAVLGGDPIEVVFTAGGTESVNLAIKGLWSERGDGAGSATGPCRASLVPAGEHHATLDTVEWLAAHEVAVLDGCRSTRSAGCASTRSRPSSPATRRSVALVTMLWANNEVGTLQPVAEVARLAARAGVPLHVDAVGAFGHVPLAFRGLAGHGCRARRRPRRAQRRRAQDRRPGRARRARASPAGEPSSRSCTAAASSAGSARAPRTPRAPRVRGRRRARRARAARRAEPARLAALRDRLVAGVARRRPRGARCSATPRRGRLPGNAHFSFPGCEGDSLLFLLDAGGLAVSTGSACQAGVPEPSHVVLAMGRSEADARGALRLTLGRTTTEADVDAVLAALPDAYARRATAGPGLARDVVRPLTRAAPRIAAPASRAPRGIRSGAPA